MGPRTTSVCGALVIVALLSAGCGSGGTPKKSAASESTMTTSHPSVTTSSATPTTSAASTASSIPSSAGPCTSGHLAVAIGQSQGAAGTFYLPLVFTNTGHTSCTLQGYPGVSLVGSNGSQIGPAAIRTPSSTALVSLAAGSSTSATIGLSDALNVCSDPATADAFVVYPPNQTTALFAPYPGLKYCVGNPNGTLQVTAVGASSGG